MEDYIFLIIAVALSIFGAINQNKKKKDHVVPSPEKETKPGNFIMDQLFGDNFFADPVPEVKPNLQPRPALKKEPLVAPKIATQTGLRHTTFASTLPDRSKKPLQPSLRKPSPELSEAEPEDDDIPGYLDDFSLRRAFVYSEILQRKY
jgi:hypothetical protein